MPVCVREQARAGQARGVDVVIVATHHHETEEAAHKGTNLVIGVVRMGGSKYSTLGLHSYKDSWEGWRQADAAAFNQACNHVARGMMKDAKIFEYPIVASVYLEQENIRVQCPRMRDFTKKGALWHWRTE